MISVTFHFLLLFFITRFIINMATEDNTWKTQAFRKCIVSKIGEAIEKSEISTTRSSVDMENYIFEKVQTKEQYLILVAQLILHVREINTKKMQDPINALEKLTLQDSQSQ